MTKQKITPSKKQRDKFKRGFFWGRLEHKFESWTTILLFLGVVFQVLGLLSRKWIYSIIASGFFILALVFRFFAGIFHKVEKHYMDKLRFGKWRNKK